jgi:hypothetical protein
MASIEQTGQVIHVGETETFGSGFQKRIVVIEYSAGKDGQYTNMLAAHMLKDNCAKLDAVSRGDVATLKCDVRSREYGGKYYTDVTCWSISVDAAAPADQSADDLPMDDNAGPMPF